MTTDEVSDGSNGSHPSEVFERRLRGVADGTELVMDVLELTTAVLMLVLFAVGVFDLGLKLVQLFETGTYTDPNAVVKLIDTALLLLIIVEVYRTVVAYIEDLNILPLVIHVGLIAMARKIISFRVDKYGPPMGDALLAGLTYGALMVILVVAFYVVHRGQEITDFDVYSEPFSTASEREESAEARGETPGPDEPAPGDD
jgi:uncharacterized membrane protein (DUF373 family)